MLNGLRHRTGRLPPEVSAAQRAHPLVAANPPLARWRRAIRRHRWPLLFVSPFFVLFAIFNVYPILFSFWLSLHDWPGLGPMEMIGLANYAELEHDPIFWNTMLNSGLIFFIYVPLMTFLAVVLASVLNAGFLKLQGLWRALIFMPNITSMVAAGYTFRLILDKDSGALNHVLAMVHMSAIPWLDDVWWARISLGLLMIWAWLGYNTVIMLAGLQTIPKELVEAAKVDGATAVQAFQRITVPLLRPVIVFSVTLSIIGTCTMFTDLRFGYAAAESYIYLAIIVAITLIQFWIVSRSDPVR